MTIIAVIIISVMFAKLDSQVLNAGYRFNDHTTRFLMRVLVLASISLYNLYLFLICSALFYLIFDYALNLFRGLPFFYKGQTSFIDKIWFGNPYLQFAFKIILLTITIII